VADAMIALVSSSSVGQVDTVGSRAAGGGARSTGGFGVLNHCRSRCHGRLSPREVPSPHGWVPRRRRECGSVPEQPVCEGQPCRGRRLSSCRASRKDNIEYSIVEQRVIPLILRTMLEEAGPPPLMRRALRGRKAGHDCFLTNHLKLGFRDHCRRAPAPLADRLVLPGTETVAADQDPSWEPVRSWR
jgi:hypothetical protein